MTEPMMGFSLVLWALLLVGLVLLAGSFALMSTVDPDRGLLTLWLWAIVGRMGLGFILPSLNLGSMHGMPPALIPQGASVVNFLRMLGGAAGVSLCAIVLEWRLAAHGARLGEVASEPALRAFNETFGCLSALTLLALVAAPFLGAYPVFVMKLMCFALYASAFNLLLGYTGLLSFGHAAFLGGRPTCVVIRSRSGV